MRRDGGFTSEVIILREAQEQCGQDEEALNLIMDPDEDKQESKPFTQDICDRQMPDFNLEDALAVLKSLSLNYGTLGYYLVVMNGKADAIINGEPYLALNLVTGKFISRIWSRSASYDRVVSMDKFIEVCTKYFQCQPCIGYTLGDEEQDSQESVIPEVLFIRFTSKRWRWGASFSEHPLDGV